MWPLKLLVLYGDHLNKKYYISNAVLCLSVRGSCCILHRSGGQGSLFKDGIIGNIALHSHWPITFGYILVFLCRIIYLT